jgi:hypothetical protein
MTAAALLWSVLFGSLGAGFFIYGKKQRKPVPMCCGIALMVFPYLVSNSIAMVAIGVGLCAVPYFYRP